MDQNPVALGLVVALVIGAMVILSIFFRFVPIGLWFQALVSGVRVSFLQLFFMRFRKVDPASIVNPLVNAHKAGLVLTADQLESHFLSGGNVARVVNALISAGKAGIPLDFKQCGLTLYHRSISFSQGGTQACQFAFETGAGLFEFARRGRLKLILERLERAQMLVQRRDLLLGLAQRVVGV